ncbi:hypothetical protein INS49_006857 [Diaporthe citri]|uniref:uncharacterized protein n=1 Tax=Diaporthe citri TaxID=83186 RepID=UPI001C7EC230|nr:uncharacterized protein INS49_006857 [Diaporthe citri]KAG6365248.1 hypothetical protein INS49_006857 [Diaporthe citri]
MHPWTPTPRAATASTNGGAAPATCKCNFGAEASLGQPQQAYRHTKLKSAPKPTVLKFEPDRPTGNRGELCDTDPTAASSKSSGTIRRPKEGRRGHPGAHDDDIGAPLVGRKVEGHDGPRSRYCLDFYSASLRGTPRRLITTSRRVGIGTVWARLNVLSGLPPVPGWR